MLFVGPFIFTAFILNMLAAYVGVTAALPFGTIFIIFLLYAFFAIPLLGLGAVVGHHYKSELPSTPTKKIPREIPSLPWFRKPLAQMFLGGLLPFSVIILELHNLMASIWGYKIYTTPAILFVTFVLLALLTAMMSVCLTYFQLSAEDHEWWWRYNTLSTTFYYLLYCVYFIALKFHYRFENLHTNPCVFSSIGKSGCKKRSKIIKPKRKVFMVRYSRKHKAIPCKLNMRNGVLYHYAKILVRGTKLCFIVLRIKFPLGQQEIVFATFASFYKCETEFF